MTRIFCIGFVIGLITAAIALCIGGLSFPFALSIFTAQFIGIVTAGCTGTLAPLLFTFIFQRDSGKWGGPLETAVQDIGKSSLTTASSECTIVTNALIFSTPLTASVVGSFAMIVITYKIMLLFGPFVIDPSDTC